MRARPDAIHPPPARRRALGALAAAIAGYLFADALPPIWSVWWWSLALLALALALLLPRARAGAAMVLSLALAAGAWFNLRVHEPSARHLAPALASAPQVPVPLTLDVLALEDPRPHEPDVLGLARFRPHAPSQRFLARARAIVVDGIAHPAGGRVLVVVEGEWPPPVRAGRAYRLTGNAFPVAPATNPGEPDRVRPAGADSFAGTIRLTAPELVAPIPRAGSPLDRAASALLSLRAAARARAQRVLDASYDDDPRVRALAGALLLGRSRSTPEDATLREAFTRLGLAHILSISGFHLAVLAYATLAVVRATGDRGWVEPALVASLVLGYTLVLPPDSPILRSAFMVLLLLMGEAFGRRYDRLTLLAWIALLLLVRRPVDLFSLGFQLTFGLTAILFWLGGRFHARFFRGVVRGDLPRASPGPARVIVHAAGALATNSVLCVAASTPAVLFRTGLFSVLAIPATLVVSPLIVLLLWCAYAALFVGFVAPDLAHACAWPARHACRLTLAAADALDSLPLVALRPPPVSLAWTLLATACVLVLARGRALSRARSILCLALLVAWLAVEWALGGRLPSGVRARVDALDVADGTCLLVRAGRDAILWDAGSLGAGANARDVVRTVRALGVWRVPSVVVSHPDLDHFGLLPELVTPLGITRALVGERFLHDARAHPGGPASALLDELARRRVRVQTVGEGDALDLGELRLEFLSPPADAPWPKDNDHSLVARLATRDDAASILLTGDVADAGIASLRARHPALACDVLELPHHGSALPLSRQWVAELNPRVVLQSTGPSRLGDGRWAPLRRGRWWGITARDGALRAEIGRDGSVRAAAFLAD